MPTLAELAAAKGFQNGDAPKEQTRVSADPAPASAATPKFGGFGKPKATGADAGGNGDKPVVASPTVPDSNGTPAADIGSVDIPANDEPEIVSTEPTPPLGLGGGLARLAGLQSKTPVSAPVPTPTGDSFSLADIEDMDSAVGTPPPPTYSDMVPAEMPPRDLPEDLSEGQKEFIELVSGLYTCMNDPQMFSGVVRSMMQELQSNNEYDRLVVDADVNALMAGLRSSMGMAKIKKAEKSRGASKAKPGKVVAMTESLDNMFSEDDW